MEESDAEYEARVQQEQWVRAARAKLLGPVLSALGHPRGRSRADIAALVDHELSVHAVPDVTEQERELLIDAATSPGAVAWRAIFGQVRTLAELFSRRATALDVLAEGHRQPGQLARGPT